jgi:hypothetical protein
MLLPTSELKSRLVKQFTTSSRSWVYSAFVTQGDIDLLLGSRAIRPGDRLLVRCQLSDVFSGACSLAALKQASCAGIQVRMSSALHVKLYLFDKVLFVGSANLTGKGLALVGYCNDELSTEGIPSARDIEIAENLWNQGVKLDELRIDQMLAFVSNLETSSTISHGNWPKELFCERRDLYCSDFPQRTVEDVDRWDSVTALRRSLAFQWLLDTTRENGGSASFGYLSQKLHKAVYDDPAPYRRTIKDLLANLLDLVERFEVDELKTTTPKRSTVVTVSE